MRIITTRLRLFRIKYNIPLTALAERMAVSNQYLSRMELGEAKPTLKFEEDLAAALEDLIADRNVSLADLEQDFYMHRGYLLEPVEEENEPRDILHSK